MAVNDGDNITAAQYNGLQSRIEQVLGTGSGDFGYGNSVSSDQVTAGDSVTAGQMDNLRSDMGKCWTHQTGDNIPLANIAVGNIIGADASGTGVTFDNSNNYTISGSIANGGFNDYLSKMTELETNRFDIDSGEQTVADIAGTTITTSWNGTISATFRVSFGNANNRRYFFNSGGELRISVAGANGTGSKDSDWSSILSNPGQIRMGYNYTTISGSNNGVTLSSIGNDAMSSSYQEIFKKVGTAAVYAENYWKVEARITSVSTFEFKVTLVDDDAGDRPDPSPPPPFGPLTDEDVTLDITGTFAMRRATGSNIAYPAPTPAVSITDDF
jgi:hypothetical protein|tara:strand:+ start:32754 stop:33737 length:984 start_codon:yes stop_codon:yes gene_type:complete